MGDSSTESCVADVAFDEVSYYDDVLSTSSTLFGVRFEACAAVKVRIDHCIFINVTFKNCILSDVHLRDTYLENVTITNSTFENFSWFCGRLLDVEMTDQGAVKTIWGLDSAVPKEIAKEKWVCHHPHKLISSAPKAKTNKAPGASLHLQQTSTKPDARSDKPTAKTFNFLGLDREVRDAIYALVVSPHTVRIVDIPRVTEILPDQQTMYTLQTPSGTGKLQYETSYVAASKSGAGMSTKIETAILLANSQTHEEASAVLYGQQPIWLTCSAEGATAWLNDCSNYHAHITSLKFYYRFEDQVMDLGPRLGRVTFSSTSTIGFIKLCDALINKEGGLDHLKIVIDKEFWQHGRVEKGIEEAISSDEHTYLLEIVRLESSGNIEVVEIDLLVAGTKTPKQAGFGRDLVKALNEMAHPPFRQLTMRPAPSSTATSEDVGGITEFADQEEDPQSGGSTDDDEGAGGGVVLADSSS